MNKVLIVHKVFLICDIIKMMKKIIVIAGDLASGKSTLADNLSDKLHFIALKKDPYKEIIVDKMSFSSREENKKISELTMDIIFFTALNAMKVGEDLIIEANFHHEELIRLEKLIALYHYQVCYLFLTGDLSVLYQRFLARVPYRHKAHLSAGLQNDFTLFSQYILDSRKDVQGFSFHPIDTTNIDKITVLQTALNILKKEDF